ncbi:hypothetical protein TWF173_006358 [Orbilia oligospora]|nr:hypothetical protein TWF173_006358 [Orbilia oligospora]
MATTNLVLIGDLPPMHLERISNIVRNLFRLEVTERTFRQIFDDAPVQSSNPFNRQYRKVEPSEESRIEYRKLVEELELILIGTEIGADILHRYINETENVLVEFEVLIEILRAISGESYKHMLDVYVHLDKDRKLYKVDKADIIQLMRHLSEDGFTSAQSLLRTTYDPIPVSDAQRKGIYRVKNLANSNFYNLLPSSITASGFPRCVIHATEELREVIPENYIPEYGELSVADWVAYQKARRGMQ